MPRLVHIVTLFIPLEPHPKSIFEERRDQTKSREMRQHMFAVAKDLIGYIFSLAYVLTVRRRSRLSRRFGHRVREERRSGMAVTMCPRKRTVDHNTLRDCATYALHVTSQTEVRIRF